MKSYSSYKCWPRRGTIPARFRHCRLELRRRRLGFAVCENKLSKRMVIHILVAGCLCTSPCQPAEPYRAEPEDTLPGINGPVPQAGSSGTPPRAAGALVDLTLWGAIGGG